MRRMFDGHFHEGPPHRDWQRHTEQHLSMHRHNAEGRTEFEADWDTSRSPLEVRIRHDSVQLRDARDPSTMLTYTFAEWGAFLMGVRAHEFDDLAEDPEGAMLDP